MKLVREAYYAWGAEVVFITSNYGGNKEIMEGCKAEGIPAFVRRCSIGPCSPRHDETVVLTLALNAFRAHCGTSESRPRSCA